MVCLCWKKRGKKAVWLYFFLYMSAHAAFTVVFAIWPNVICVSVSILAVCVCLWCFFLRSLFTLLYFVNLFVCLIVNSVIIAVISSAAYLFFTFVCNCFFSVSHLQFTVIVFFKKKDENRTKKTWSTNFSLIFNFICIQHTLHSCCFFFFLVNVFCCRYRVICMRLRALSCVLLITCYIIHRHSS